MSIVNDHVGAIAHKVVVNPNDLADDLDDMIRSQGEPFGSTSIYAQYRVFKAAREAGITVTLDGQGADELLAGYNGYPSAFIHSLIDQQRFSEVMPFLAQWMRCPGRSIHNAVSMLLRPLLPIQLQKIARKVIMRSPIPDWINTEVLVARGVYVSPSSPAAHAPDAMGRRLVAALRAALTGQGLCSLLRHGDRNSMRWTIESRVPFLTIEMAEFLLSLPESYLLGPDGETKRIFRAAMRGIVPDKILDRRDKIGFQTPEKNWLRSQNAKIQQWLSTAETLSFINLKQGREEINGMLDGSKTFGWHAWVLISFCRWVQVQGQ
jgi:asparagine synthase (glutamine-hydrolysing)